MRQVFFFSFSLSAVALSNVCFSFVYRQRVPVKLKSGSKRVEYASSKAEPHISRARHPKKDITDGRHQLLCPQKKG